VIPLTTALYNFTHWEIVDQDDEGHFQIHVRGAIEFTEIPAYTALGFIEVIAERLSHRPASAQYTRKDPGHIVYDVRIKQSRERAA
jgi:hypothetical protein